MNLRDYLNLQSTLGIIAAEWGCPVVVVKAVIQRTINESWEKAMLDPEAMARWEAYFPSGKPTAEQYILQVGHAYENKEDLPELLTE